MGSRDDNKIGVAVESGLIANILRRKTDKETKRLIAETKVVC